MAKDKSTDNGAEPAKRGPGRPPKDETVPLPADLTFEDAPEPIKRHRATVDNPFVKPLGESYEYDKAVQVTVPEAAVRTVENKLRRAATVLGIGVSIAAGEPDNGQVTVVFQGKERRARKAAESADEATETAGEGPAGGSDDTAGDANLAGATA